MLLFPSFTLKKKEGVTIVLLLINLQTLLKLCQERDYYKRELEGKRGPLTPPDHLETVHLYNELNKYKVKVNHFVNEL